MSKLSQIPPSPPGAPSDQIVGVKGGTTDALYSIAQVIAPAQRSITSSAQLPLLSSDGILNINAVTDLSITVLLASTRSGVSFTFKNLRGSHTQTLFPTGGDTFDTLVSYPLDPGAVVTLLPFNDGVNSGYAII